jgi:hypothetical protein
MALAAKPRFAPSLLAVLALALIGSVAAPSGASAELVHRSVTGEYGREGPAATGLEGGCYLAYESAENRIYVVSGGKIYGLTRTGQGAVTAVGGGFPVSVAASGCVDEHVAVDQQSGNVYYVGSSNTVSGFTPSGAAVPNFPLTRPGSELCGVATTAAGEIWTGNYSVEGVSKFGADGSELGSFSVGYSPCKIGFDTVSGNLFVLQYGFGVPIEERTAASGYSATAHTYPTPTEATGFAVDSAHHKLYVPVGEAVDVYDTATGGLIEEVTFGGSTHAVAVDEATQNLFVADSTNNVIKELPAAVVPKATTGAQLGDNQVTGNADPDGAGQITECFFEIGTAPGNYSQQQPCEGTAPFSGQVTATLSGLTIAKAYHYRLVLGTADPLGVAKGFDETFEIPAPLPTIDATGADVLSSSSARMHAAIVPNFAPTQYRFDYGPTSAYGESTPLSEPLAADGAEHLAETIVSELAPGTVYHYRAMAINFSGVTLGPDQILVTPAQPTIDSISASAVGQTTAHLGAGVNPNSADTTVFFEYGPLPAYGLRTPSVPAGSGNDDVPVGADLQNLSPGTTYHYRVIAQNQYGTALGFDQTLQTLPASAPEEPKPATCKHGFVKRHGKCVRRKRRHRRHKNSTHGHTRK